MTDTETKTNTLAACPTLTTVLCGFGLKNMRTVCNRCGTTLGKKDRWAGAYSCDTCNSWTLNVRHEEIPMFNFDA